MIAHNKKYTLVGIVGKSGSGKDELFKKIHKVMGSRIHPVLHWTTRPKRENEEDGREYYFITEETFKNRAEKGEFMTAECFNGWWYGLHESDLYGDRVNLAILNPREALWLQKMHPHPDIDLYLIHLDVEDYVLQARLFSTRSDHNEVNRRIQADAEDWEKYVTQLVFERNLSNATPKDLHFNVGFLCGQIDMLEMPIDEYINRAPGIFYQRIIRDSYI